MPPECNHVSPAEAGELVGKKVREEILLLGRLGELVDEATVRLYAYPYAYPRYGRPSLNLSDLRCREWPAPVAELASYAHKLTYARTWGHCSAPRLVGTVMHLMPI